MQVPSELYRRSHSLLPDLYKLTIAYGQLKSAAQDKEAVFHLSFRKNPFQGGFSVACGLAYVVDFASHFRFTADDVAYLAELQGSDDKALFDREFLNYLQSLRFACHIDAIPVVSLDVPH